MRRANKTKAVLLSEVSPKNTSLSTFFSLLLFVPRHPFQCCTLRFASPLEKKHRPFLEEALGVPPGDSGARERAARAYKSFSVVVVAQGRVPPTHMPGFR